jgi:hypothetical protein
MNAPSGGFRYAVNRVRPLAPHSDFDNARIIFDELPYSFAAKFPQVSQLTDAVVSLESGVIEHFFFLLPTLKQNPRPGPSSVMPATNAGGEILAYHPSRGNAPAAI